MPHHFVGGGGILMCPCLDVHGLTFVFLITPKERVRKPYQLNN